MNTYKKLSVAVAVLAGSVSLSVSATPYQSATAPAPASTTISFDANGLADGATVTTQYAGVSFENFRQVVGYDSFANFSGAAVGNFQDGQSIYTPGAITFDSAVTNATFNFLTNPGSTTFRTFLNGTLVETAIFNTSTNGLFTGFLNSRFDRLTIDASNTGNGVFGIDNLAFTPAAAAVPETATWGMMLLGFGMIGAAARSRKVKTLVAFA